MNKRMIAFVIGRILLTEAALLVIPLVVALLYGESLKPFLLPMALLVLLGALMSFRRPRSTALFARDGLAVVALACHVRFRRAALLSLRGDPQLCGLLF